MSRNNEIMVSKGSPMGRKGHRQFTSEVYRPKNEQINPRYVNGSPSMGVGKETF